MFPPTECVGCGIFKSDFNPGVREGGCVKVTQMINVNLFLQKLFSTGVNMIKIHFIHV